MMKSYFFAVTFVVKPVRDESRNIERKKDNHVYRELQVRRDDWRPSVDHDSLPQEFLMTTGRSGKRFFASSPYFFPKKSCFVSQRPSLRPLMVFRPVFARRWSEEQAISRRPRFGASVKSEKTPSRWACVKTAIAICSAVGELIS